jgi:hypothetical protein
MTEPTVPVLTQTQLNRATLARQLLLTREPLSPTEVIERLVGMQAQWPSSPYIGILARTTTFHKAQLEELLLSGAVLKATVMRETLHLVTLADYALIRAAVAETPHLHERPEGAGLAPSIRAFAEAEAESTPGPLTMAAALAYMEREHGLTGQQADSAWHSARLRAHVIHHPETALWKSYPRGLFTAVDEPEFQASLPARVQLIRRYLQAFGPASTTDIAVWSKMRMTEIRPAIDELDADNALIRFRTEAGKELLDLPDAPRPDPLTPAPIRFLPKWDNVLLSHKDRTRMLADGHKLTVFRLNGEVRPTVLIDGFVAATWTATQGRVTVEPFTRIPRQSMRELREEIARLEAFISE